MAVSRTNIQMNLDELSDDELLRRLKKLMPEKYGHVEVDLPQLHKPAPNKKPLLYDMPDLSSLPPGQRRAIEALIGGDHARTYLEASRIAQMAEGTLLTHINRVRDNHPKLYRSIRRVREAQLAERHELALESARDHSRAYFRRKANRRYYLRFGHHPWERSNRSGG